MQPPEGDEVVWYQVAARASSKLAHVRTRIQRLLNNPVPADSAEQHIEHMTVVLRNLLEMKPPPSFIPGDKCLACHRPKDDTVEELDKVRGLLGTHANLLEAARRDLEVEKKSAERVPVARDEGVAAARRGDGAGSCPYRTTVTLEQDAAVAWHLAYEEETERQLLRTIAHAAKVVLTEKLRSHEPTSAETTLNEAFAALGVHHKMVGGSL